MCRTLWNWQVTLERDWNVTSDAIMNEPTTSINLVDLKAAVGSHFFVWSQLEAALREAVEELETACTPQKVRGIAQTIKRWKLLQDGFQNPNSAHSSFVNELFLTMSEGLDIRNKIAHGIVGWSVMSSTNDAHITTELAGEETTIPYEKLTSMNEQLMVLRSHLSRVTSITLEPERWKYSDLYTEVRNMLAEKTER